MKAVWVHGVKSVAVELGPAGLFGQQLRDCLHKKFLLRLQQWSVGHAAAAILSALSPSLAQDADRMQAARSGSGLQPQLQIGSVRQAVGGTMGGKALGAPMQQLLLSGACRYNSALQLLQLLEEQLQPVSSLTRLHARVVGALDIELASLVKSEVCSKLAGGRGLAMVKLADEGVQQLLKDPQPGQPQPAATLCANVVADRIAAAIKENAASHSGPVQLDLRLLQSLVNKLLQLPVDVLARSSIALPQSQEEDWSSMELPQEQPQTPTQQLSSGSSSALPLQMTPLLIDLLFLFVDGEAYLDITTLNGSEQRYNYLWRLADRLHTGRYFKGSPKAIVETAVAGAGRGQCSCSAAARPQQQQQRQQ
ncbi:hypothetical protein OEZ86_010118 [Tetradesmus obliquus]|nr:hypothetical protein OEZ86_010118 [Tetradesmus obliquus]